MRKNFRFYLDFIPLIVLIIYAVILIDSNVSDGIVMNWRHYIGLGLLLICSIMFFIRHLFGVLFVGSLLVLACIGLISFTPGISTFSFGKDSDSTLSLVGVHPIFFLWIVVYFIICWRHIVGVGTKKYWDAVKKGER